MKDNLNLFLNNLEKGKPIYLLINAGMLIGNFESHEGLNDGIITLSNASLIPSHQTKQLTILKNSIIGWGLSH
jgi:hypothetical protein